MEAEKQAHITIGTTLTYGKFILSYIFENDSDSDSSCHIKVVSESSISLLESLR